MKTAFFVATLLLATGAHAQSAGSEGTVAIAAGPPAALALVLDIALLGTLVASGRASRGIAITDISVGSVGVIISAICLAIGLSSSTSSALWNAISAGALAASAGSLVVGFYAAATEAEEPMAPSDQLSPWQRTRVPKSAPQLQLLPIFGKGFFGGGLSVTL
jgi:hypothetical protein